MAPSDTLRDRSGGRHTDFHPGFLWVALAAAILAGFGLAAHLSFVLGFGLPLGAAFPTLVQTHGHVQLVGWAGLFVMGVSLFFIPRLASAPLRHPRWVGLILWLMAAGLLLRAGTQPMLAYLWPGAVRGVLASLLAASGVLEGAGIALYLLLLIGTLRGTGDLQGQPAFAAVRPYFGMMAAGWTLYGGVNLVLVLAMARHEAAVANVPWNEFAIDCFIALVLLPVAMAFSVRLLPMFLALSAAFWPVRATGYAYFAAAGVQLFARLLPLSGLATRLAESLGGLGGLCKGLVLLWFVWKLDLLTRRRSVERPARFLLTGPDRAPTRPGLPDFGEFGRFELLVYPAYVWLVLAAAYEILDGAMALAGQAGPVDPGLLRHIYLLGFITLLILGVAVRMLPGFLQKRAVASPGLVEATIWLGNTAVIFRVLPLLLPSALLHAVPGGAALARAAFGLSGTIALAAVVCLAANLWWTAHSSS